MNGSDDHPDDRRAVVTGATGFIGRHLCRRLAADGWQVTPLVRPDADVADLAGQPRTWPTSGEAAVELFDELRPEVCFHLATRFQTSHLPADVVALVDGNVTLAALVAEAAASVGGCRVVNAATYWQHRGGATYHPTNLYAAMKQASEDVLRWAALERGVHLHTLVVFNAYGPGEPDRRITSLLVDAALTGAPLDASPGEQLLDLLHVEDLVGGLLVAAQTPVTDGMARHELRQGTLLTVRQLAEVIAEVTGAAPDVRFGARPYGGTEMFELWDVADPLPGWEARIPLAEGLASLVADRRRCLGLEAD